MKEMLLAKKAELQKRDKKGFTLMELLIVVAIIAVLVAIAIPLFTAQLERSRQTTDLANIRSSYAEAMAELMSNPGQTSATGTGEYAVQNTHGKLDEIDLNLTGELGDYLDDTTPVTGTIQVTVNGDGEVTSILKTSASTPQQP